MLTDLRVLLFLNDCFSLSLECVALFCYGFSFCLATVIVRVGRFSTCPVVWNFDVYHAVTVDRKMFAIHRYRQAEGREFCLAVPCAVGCSFVLCRPTVSCAQHVLSSIGLLPYFDVRILLAVNAIYDVVTGGDDITLIIVGGK